MIGSGEEEHRAGKMYHVGFAFSKAIQAQHKRAALARDEWLLHGSKDSTW